MNQHATHSIRNGVHYSFIHKFNLKSFKKLKKKKKKTLTYKTLTDITCSELCSSAIIIHIVTNIVLNTYKFKLLLAVRVHLISIISLLTYKLG